MSSRTVEPAGFDISEMLEFSSDKQHGIFSGNQMGTYSEEMVRDGLLPLDHAVSRNIKSWSSEITTPGSNRGVQGGYGNIEPADVEELPTTFTSKPEMGTLKADLAWNKMNGVSEFPRTFHSQDMPGTLKTAKSLDGMAEDEMEPIIIDHEKMVRNWTFWTTLIFCCLFSCSLGAVVSLCVWGMAWGIPFDAGLKLHAKKVPGGKALVALKEGDVEKVGSAVGEMGSNAVNS